METKDSSAPFGRCKTCSAPLAFMVIERQKRYCRFPGEEIFVPTKRDYVCSQSGYVNGECPSGEEMHEAACGKNGIHPYLFLPQFLNLVSEIRNQAQKGNIFSSILNGKNVIPYQEMALNELERRAQVALRVIKARCRELS
jgi:hypothetical protein